MSELLDYREAAALLRRSPSTLRKDVMAKRVPVVKMFGRHGRVLFERQALEAFIAQGRIQPQAQQRA